MRENVLRFSPHPKSRLKASRQFNALDSSFIQLDVVDDVYAHMGYFAGSVFIAQADRVIDDHLHYVEIDGYGFIARVATGLRSTLIVTPLDRETPASTYPRERLASIGVILGAYPRGLGETLCGRILLEVKQGLAAFRQNVGMMRWRADERGNHLVSPKMRLWISLMGGKAEDWEGWRWIDFIHLEDRSAYLTRWEEALESGKPYLNQGRICIAGTWLWMVISANPIRDAAGQINEWEGFLHFEAVEKETRLSA